MTRRFVSVVALVSGALVTLGLLSTQSLASKRDPASKPRIFAQRLVDEFTSKHPEVIAVELAVQSTAGCSTIAASDSKDIGEKCDEDELDPMRTGEPHVERERDGFDVTLPLHDTLGQVIGAIGMDFKAKPGQRSGVIEQARKIVREVEGQIPSKAKLFEAVE